TFRIAALRAVSQDAKGTAIKYLLMAFYEYPKLTMNWRTLGTIAGVAMPLSMRSRLSRWISDSHRLVSLSICLAKSLLRTHTRGDNQRQPGIVQTPGVSEGGGT